MLPSIIRCRQAARPELGWYRPGGRHADHRSDERLPAGRRHGGHPYRRRRGRHLFTSTTTIPRSSNRLARASTPSSSGMIDGYSLVNAPNVENLIADGRRSLPRHRQRSRQHHYRQRRQQHDRRRAGNDVLTGGAVSDTLSYTPGNGNEIVTDFQDGCGWRHPATQQHRLQDVGRRHGRDETSRYRRRPYDRKRRNNNARKHQPPEFHGRQCQYRQSPDGIGPDLQRRFQLALRRAGSRFDLAHELCLERSRQAIRWPANSKCTSIPAFPGLPATQASTSLGLNPFSIQNGHLVITAQPMPASATPYTGSHVFVGHDLDPEQLYPDLRLFRNDGHAAQHKRRVAGFLDAAEHR